ncbi:MAG: RNA methyltransferase [Myxococcales bacterium]|nr:RNA methyltransferase [Myxococcales bacterium]
MSGPKPIVREVVTGHEASAALPDVGPPGTIAALLAPFVHDRRLERMRGVLARRTRHLTVLLEEIHDPHNIAACVRSCDAFGIQHVHLVPTRGRRPKAARGVSRGADRWLTMHLHPTIEAAIAALRAEGYLIAATDISGPSAPLPVHDAPLDRPLCVAFGNEHDGISETLRQAADLAIQVPMVGFVESLNISVACAIVLHELRTRVERSPAGVPPLADAERTALLDRFMFEDIERASSVLATVLARRGAVDAR